MGISKPRHFEAHKVLAHEHELTTLDRRRQIRYSINDSDDIVLRKNDDISEICVVPNCFDLFDDVLLFSLFRDSAVFHERGYGYGKPEQIRVKVLSTVLSRENCEFIDDKDLDYLKIEKKLRESVFVGEVLMAPQECTLKQGMKVTSLRRGPVQARQVALPVDALIPVPSGIDTAEATALVSTFVPAMGLLFHGEVDKRDRFSATALKGCDVLVTGGGSDEADAVVSLALLSGANRIFVLQSKLSMATNLAHSVRVELVSDDPDEWHPVIDRYMDIIIDLEYPKNFKHLYGKLKNTGRLVCRRPKISGILAPFNELLLELKLLPYPNASMYDLDEQIENEHPELMRDMRHLFGLLKKRKIRPSVERYIRVKEIDVTREHMKRNPGSGAIVCEPWRR